MMMTMVMVMIDRERGNQRERDRERAQARAGNNKSKQPRNDGLTPEQRRQRDAKALQEKTAKKAERAAGANNFDGGSKNK
uniref:Small EDRK-rich factor-like N-terminal domain-containing protein n=1 Tax=Cucumis melo TaxID=3656 RepID=A0A9I9DP40_CUCME